MKKKQSKIYQASQWRKLVQKNGQVIIPVAVSRHAGMKPWDSIQIESDGSRIVITRPL